MKPCELAERRRAIPRDLAAGALQFRQPIVWRQRAPDAVQEEPHRHAGLGPRDQRLQELLTGASRFPDVGEEQDTPLGRVHRVEDRREERVAVSQQLDRAAGVDRCVDSPAEGGQELCAVDRR